MCSFVMFLEAKEDELKQLLAQKQGISAWLVNWYRGKEEVGGGNWENKK